MAVKPIPDGYHSVTPYMMVKNAAGLLQFMKQAFNASVSEKMVTPDGAIMHAEAVIGDSHIMVAEARGDWPAMPGGIYLYVEDVDAVFRQAVAAGGTVIMEPATMFYGDRHGGVKDLCGNLWWIATRVENLTVEELYRRGQEFAAKAQSS